MSRKSRKSRISDSNGQKYVQYDFNARINQALRDPSGEHAYNCPLSNTAAYGCNLATNREEYFQTPRTPTKTERYT